MNNIFTFVILIITVVSIAEVAKLYLKQRQAKPESNEELEEALSKFEDLEERIRVLERRISTTAESNDISIGPVILETSSMQVIIAGKETLLSKSEYMLLKTLMQNAGRIQTRNNLESQLYSWGEEVNSNALEVHIHHLQ